MDIRQFPKYKLSFNLGIRCFLFRAANGISNYVLIKNSLETLIVAYILKYMYMLFSIDSKNGNTDRTMFGRQQVQQ